MNSGNQPLPQKEAQQFRLLVKYYETKQYKRALKAADQILKKFPKHGETLAMKGLTLSQTNKISEAYDLVKTGLMSDIKSHICWHVYGLLHRHQRDYHESMKCYMNALRLDKGNIQILKDLALLQIQTRQLEPFVDTRSEILFLKPNHRGHWLTLIVAHFVAGQYSEALSVLQGYYTTVDEPPPPPPGLGALGSIWSILRWCCFMW